MCEDQIGSLLSPNFLSRAAVRRRRFDRSNIPREGPALDTFTVTDVAILNARRFHVRGAIPEEMRAWKEDEFPPTCCFSDWAFFLI